MRATAGITGLSDALAKERERIERAMTGAMKDASGGMKEELRQQVVAAGLGVRLSRTWQGTVYPRTGSSLEPAAYVYSKAPRIIAAFARGATITPRFTNFLAIPTESVPRKLGGRGAKRRMSPEEIEHHFNQDLTILPNPRRAGSFLGLVNVVRAKNRRRPGFRQATKGRLAQGRERELILMFVFVRRTVMPRLLDLNAVAQRWGSRVAPLFNARMGRG